MKDTKSNKSPLIGRTLYIPRMSFSAAKLTAASFKSANIMAEPSPPSDAKTLELGAKYLNGDECLPERVTLGNFLKIVEAPSYNPEKTAFLMPTSGGPCRFGQYSSVFKKILKEKGFEQTLVMAPTSSNAYEGFGESVQSLLRTSWNAILCADILRKLHLSIRPYELEKGMANEIFHQCLDDLSIILAISGIKHKHKLFLLRQTLITAKERYHKIPVKFTKDKPLIGVVGEIYCRLNEFSNEYLINKIEDLGGEVWLADIGEWVWYTNDEQRLRLIRAGKRYSKDMLIAKIKFKVQHSDEHYLLQPFKDNFKGSEEPTSIHNILNYSHPYLPQEGALGEMVINAGKSIYMQKKGIDGIIDISPFSCMNGIVCEAVYPQISKDYNNIPMRLFYFDGSQLDLDRDVGIFLELARNYKSRKKINRIYPLYFK